MDEVRRYGRAVPNYPRQNPADSARGADGCQSPDPKIYWAEEWMVRLDPSAAPADPTAGSPRNIGVGGASHFTGQPWLAPVHGYRKKVRPPVEAGRSDSGSDGRRSRDFSIFSDPEEDFTQYIYGRHPSDQVFL